LTPVQLQILGLLVEGWTRWAATARAGRPSAEDDRTGDEMLGCKTRAFAGLALRH
jgi:hypothetical protein